MATFKGKDIVFIKGRGVVLFGDVIEGTVKIGMKVALHNAEIAIAGIEIGKCVDERGEIYTQSGLLFESDKRTKENFWAILAVRDVIFEVHE